MFVCFVGDSPQWARFSSFTRFLDHTQRRTTIGRTPLDEWSARRRDLYLTTHNTHNRHPCPRWDSNPQFQQASGRRNRAATGIGFILVQCLQFELVPVLRLNLPRPVVAGRGDGLHITSIVSSCSCFEQDSKMIYVFCDAVPFFHNVIPFHGKREEIYFLHP